MSREWPEPPADRTIQLIGDLHIGASYPVVRRDKIVTDLSSPLVPDPAVRLLMGDFTQAGTAAQASTAVTWADTMPGDAPWYSLVGNHDLWDDTPGDTMAESFGMSAANYTIDLGFCVVVCVGPIGIDTPDRTTVVIAQATVDWLDTTLTSLAGRDVLVAAHAPLYNTVLGGASTENRSDAAGFFICAPTYASRDDGVRDGPIRDVLDAHSNVRAWLSGHTHTSFATDLAGTVNLGTRTIGWVNTSAVFYVGKDFAKPAHHPILSLIHI